MRYTVKTEEHAPLIKGHMKLGGANRAYEVDVNSRYFTLNAKPWIPVMGEIHYSRVCCEDWERELRKMKAGGDVYKRQPDMCGKSTATVNNNITV